MGFLLIPIYTHALTPSDYGVLELLTMTIDILSMMFWVGLTPAMSKFYYEYDDSLKRQTIISTAFITAIGIFSIGVVIMFTCSRWLSELIFDTDYYAKYFHIMFLSMLLQTGIEIPLSFIRIQQKSLRCSVINTVKVFIQFILNILFVAIWNYGVLGVLYSTLITSILMSLYLTFVTFKEVGFRYSLKDAKNMISFGAPLIFTSLGAFMINFSDRFFIKHFIGAKEVGIYSLGYKFGWLISFLIMAPFGQIWFAKLYEIANTAGAHETYSRMFTYLNMALILVGFFISLFFSEAIRIISPPSYWEAARITPIITLSYIINGWFIYTQIGILIRKKTKYAAYVSLLCATLSLMLNYLLIPRFSIYGAASTTVLTMFLRFFVSYHISQRLYKVTYSWHSIYILLCSATLLYLVSVNISIPSITLRLCFKTALFLLFCTIVYFCGGLPVNVRRSMIASLRSPYQSISITET